MFGDWGHGICLLLAALYLMIRERKFTSQISLWGGILPSKEHAKFWIHTSNKHRFIDQGSNLRGKEYNLTLHWHVMPKTSKMFADKIVMPSYRLPEEYR
ncbi:hypothetical protein AAZX31_19G049300 [Glycine max]